MKLENHTAVTNPAVGEPAFERHENVLFHFLGADEDSHLPGTVIVREAEMVLDIPGGYGPYLIVGKLQKTWFAGANSLHGREYDVDARWANVGDAFVGLWVEGGYDYLFSFSLE